MDELADMYDAEHRIIKALPNLAKAATCPDLKAAIQSHLKETEGHVKRLEQVFQSFDEKAKGKKCEATVGLLEEGDEIAAEFKGSPAINAALISMQKVEITKSHRMVLREWARLLGNQEAAGLLQEILVEEKAANHSLSELARFSNNEEALDESDQNGSNEDSGDQRAAYPHRGIRPVTTRRSRAVSMSR